MCQFIETIRVFDGRPCNLPYHVARVNDTCRHFWNRCFPIPFEQVLRKVRFPAGLCKLRFVYDESGVQDVSCQTYVPRKIGSLQIVYDDDVDYSFKKSDRSYLNLLKLQQGDADEILIVKQGIITDTSFTNVAFFDGHQWFTPSAPLLRGTMRASLLDRHAVIERDIRVADLSSYRAVSLINAMLPLRQSELPVTAIRDQRHLLQSD